MTRPVATLAALAAAFAAPAAANDLWPDRPEPAPTIAVAEDSRPHLVAGVLYWNDHRLVALCAASGGAFGKLPNSAVYACVPAE